MHLDEGGKVHLDFFREADMDSCQDFLGVRVGVRLFSNQSPDHGQNTKCQAAMTVMRPVRKHEIFETNLSTTFDDILGGAILEINVRLYRREEDQISCRGGWNRE